MRGTNGSNHIPKGIRKIVRHMSSLRTEKHKRGKILPKKCSKQQGKGGSTRVRVNEGQRD